MFDKLKMKIGNWLSTKSANFGPSRLAQYFKIANEEDAAISSDKAFETNPYVNIAVDKIATNILRAPFKIKNGEKEITSGPIYELFRDVNPQMSRSQLFEATVSWLLTRGEAIWILDKEDGVMPTQIYIRDPKDFESTLNVEGTKIVLWKYKKEGQEIPFLPDEIVHFMKWNPFDNFRGVNPLFAQADSITEDRLVSNNNISLLNNRSVPDGLLTSDLPITEEQGKDIKERWNKEHKGSKRSNKIAVLGLGVDYKTIALSPLDMQFKEMKQWNRSVILGKYGVPAIVAGYKDDQTPLSGSDTNEQLRLFWTLTLLPLIRFLQDKLETEFGARFAPGLDFVFDITDVPELQVDIGELSVRLTSEVKEGITTLNEAREILGKDPVPWGNTWWKPSDYVDVSQPITTPQEKSIFKENKIKYSTIQKKSLLFSHKKIVDENTTLLGKSIQEAVTGLRSKVLGELSKGIDFLKPDDTFTKKFWSDERVKIKTLSDDCIKKIKNDTLTELMQLFDTLNIDSEYKSYIENDTPVTNDIVKLADMIKGTLKPSLKDLDIAREKFKMLQSKIDDFVAIEVGRLISDIRIKAFEAVGIKYIEWITGDDLKGFGPFPGHAIDGEIVRIGEKFSNGLIAPMTGNNLKDLKGCACVILPAIFEEDE